MEFSQQLDQLMDMVKCSANQLAEASGTSPSTISRYHSGKRRPASPASFAAAMAELALRYCSAGEKQQCLAALLGDQTLAQDGSALREELEAWLLQPAPSSEEQVRAALSGARRRCGRPRR